MNTGFWGPHGVWNSKSIPFDSETSDLNPEELVRIFVLLIDRMHQIKILEMAVYSKELYREVLNTLSLYYGIAIRRPWTASEMEELHKALPSEDIIVSSLRLALRIRNDLGGCLTIYISLDFIITSDVHKMARMGNIRSAMIYEERLAPRPRFLLFEDQLPMFISEKYLKKRYTGARYKLFTTRDVAPASTSFQNVSDEAACFVPPQSTHSSNADGIIGPVRKSNNVHATIKHNPKRANKKPSPLLFVSDAPVTIGLQGVPSVDIRKIRSERRFIMPRDHDSAITPAKLPERIFKSYRTTRKQVRFNKKKMSGRLPDIIEEEPVEYSEVWTTVENLVERVCRQDAASVILTITSAIGDLNLGKSAFPPFGVPGGMSGMIASPMAAPQMAPVSPSYSIPNKTNAFADLSLGKVMSSMHMPHRQGGHAVTAAPVAPVSGNNMNFDDLLGLFSNYFE